MDDGYTTSFVISTLCNIFFVFHTGNELSQRGAKALNDDFRKETQRLISIKVLKVYKLVMYDGHNTSLVISTLRASLRFLFALLCDKLYCSFYYYQNEFDLD